MDVGQVAELRRRMAYETARTEPPNGFPKSYDIRCNWKVMAEGFLEVYHAKTIHKSRWPRRSTDAAQ